MPVHASSYDVWLAKVREALDSINMRMEDWQAVSAFDFEREFAAGAFPDDAALRANRFWWLEQNRKINQACCQGRSKTRPVRRSKSRPVEQVGNRGLSGRRTSGAKACAA